MKNAQLGLALALLAALPACTIHYYGPPPGDARYNQAYEYHTTDTVYITKNTTTVVNQPNGNYPNGGTRNPNGGGRYPNGGGNHPNGGGSYPNGGGNYPNGGGNYPNGGGNYPNGGGNHPTGGTTPNSNGGSTTHPTTGGTTTGTPAPVRTGGVGPTRANTGGTGQPTGSTPNYPTGGIKPMPTRTPTPGDVKPPQPSTEFGGTKDADVRTGGIKPPRGTSGTGSDATPDYPTGGVKPIPTRNPPQGDVKPLQPNTDLGGTDPDVRTGGIKPVRTGGGTDPDVRTGGIKPIRTTPMTEDNANPDLPTGGVKPIPGRNPNQGDVKPPTTSDFGGSDAQPGSDPGLTGGIKPIRGTEPPAGPDRAGQTDFGGQVREGQTGGIKPPRGNVDNGSSAGSGVPALVYAKMPSRGPSPSYTATVWPNGRVVYVGQQNVPRLGTYELQLPTATLAAVQQQAQGVNFPELQETYSSGATDIPATRLTMYDGAGNSKTVTVEDNAPAEVQALFDYLNNELSQLAAGGSTEEAPQTMRRGR